MVGPVAPTTRPLRPRSPRGPGLLRVLYTGLPTLFRPEESQPNCGLSVVRWKDGDVIFVSSLASKALQREKDKDKDARMLMSSAPNSASGLSPQHVAAISLQPKVPRAFLSTMPLHAGTPRWDEHTTQAHVLCRPRFFACMRT